MQRNPNEKMLKVLTCRLGIFMTKNATSSTHIMCTVQNVKGVKGYNFHILWLKIKCARGWLANGLGRTTFRPSSLLVVKLVYVYEGPLWMLLYRTPHHTTPIFLTQYICRLSHSCKMGVCWVCLLAEEKYTGTQKLTESRQTL